MSEKLIPFGWYGGKYSHLNWLLPLLSNKKCYLEPFGGSAAVLLNREPAEVETYNDLDEEVVNFFKVLRDNREELIEKISLTPYSRQEFEKSVKVGEDLDDIERARLFFVKAGQVFGGVAQKATSGRWARCIEMSRRGMSGSTSQFYNKIKKLDKIAQRLRRVQIESKPALEVIDDYDNENCLIYCDPPYPHSAREDTNAYGYEMTEEEHRELAEVLKDCEGEVAISSYECELMDELYSDWNKHVAPEKRNPSGDKKESEVLWTSYSVEEISKQNQETLKNYNDS